MAELTIGPNLPNDTAIPVLLDGSPIATLMRPAGGLWRNAVLIRQGEALAHGLPSVASYLAAEFGVVADIQIEIHAGYLTIYGADGLPHARVIDTGGAHQLRIFNPHHSETFASREAAISVGSYRAKDQL